MTEKCPNCNQTEHGAIRMRDSYNIMRGHVIYKGDVIQVPVHVCMSCGTVYVPRNDINSIIGKVEEDEVDCSRYDEYDTIS